MDKSKCALLVVLLVNALLVLKGTLSIPRHLFVNSVPQGALLVVPATQMNVVLASMEHIWTEINVLNAMKVALPATVQLLLAPLVPLDTSSDLLNAKHVPRIVLTVLMLQLASHAERALLLSVEGAEAVLLIVLIAIQAISESVQLVPKDSSSTT